MKILFDANPLAAEKKSGVGYFTLGLIKALSEIPDNQLVGHYQNFLGRKSAPNIPNLKHTRFVQSRIVPTKLLNILRRVGVQLPYEVFTRQKADITLFTNFVAQPLLSGGKKVTIIYDTAFLDCPEYLPTRLQTYLAKWVPYSISSSDLIVVNSSFTKKRLVHHYSVPAEKIIIAPIPAAEHSKPDATILKTLGLSYPYLLFVGTIEPRKNIANLVSAYADLPVSVRSEYPLVLAGGKGWKDESTLKLVEQLRQEGVRIITTGYVTDSQRSALYDNAYVCVQPSFYEGFGMPILEAMSYGKPVVCSDLEVFKEVAGDAALYMDQTSPESITKALQSVLTEKALYSSLRKKSVARFNSYATWKQVAQDLYEQFKLLV